MPQTHPSYKQQQSFVPSEGFHELSSPLQHDSDKQVVVPRTRIRSTVRFQDPPISESISMSDVAKVECSSKPRSRLSLIRPRSRGRDVEKTLKANAQLGATRPQNIPITDEAITRNQNERPATEKGTSRQRLKRRSTSTEPIPEVVVMKSPPQTPIPPKKRDSFLGSLFKRDSIIHNTSGATSPRSTSGNAPRQSLDLLDSASAERHIYATISTSRHSSHTRTGSTGLNQHPVSELDLFPSSQGPVCDPPRPPTTLQPDQDSQHPNIHIQDFCNSDPRHHSSTFHSDTDEHHSHITYLQNNNIFPRRARPAELDLNPHAPPPPSDAQNGDRHFSSSNPFIPCAESPPPLVPPKSPSRTHYARPSQDDIPALPKLPPPHSSRAFESRTGRTPSVDAGQIPRWETARPPTLLSNYGIGLAISPGLSELEDEPVTMSPTSWPGQEWKPTAVLT